MNAPEVWFPHLGIEIEKLNRAVFTIGGFSAYWYGVIIGLAMITAFSLICKEAKRTGQNADNYFDFLLYMAIFGIIGARIYYVAFSWDAYKDDLVKIFALREGGLAIYGGIIAGTITGVIYARRKKMDVWLMGDTVTPFLALGQAIGRWGNFFNREAFGGYTDGLFAMRYLKSDVSAAPPALAQNTVFERGAEYIQVHPTFLYESAWNICVFGILLYILRKNKTFDGQIMCLYFMLYGSGRFFVEGLRVDQLKLWGANIAVSQMLSLILIAVAAIVYFWRKKAADKAAQGL